METKEIRALSADEIKAKIDEMRHELINLRFQQITGQLTDTSRLRTIRRDVGRMETILTEKRKATEQEGAR